MLKDFIIMLQQSDKYFQILHGTNEATIDSKICDLELTVKIALSMKRIPIIREDDVSGITQYSKLARNVSIDWERYINLSGTRILQVESGKIKELPDTLQYIYERNFHFNSYAKNHIRYINRGQIYDEENEKYPLIFLSDDDKKTDQGAPNFHHHSDHNQCPSFLVIFPFSQEVNDLTDIVLDYFGVSRPDMELLINILHRRHRYMTGCPRVNFNYYACLDVRCERNISTFPKSINKYVMRLRVEKVIRKVLHNRGYYKKQLPFYIRSDIKDIDYFDFLKPKYNVYKYTDFRELKERFTHSDSADYNLLYLVENNIMRYALVKVFSNGMNRFAFEGPWSNSLFGMGKTWLHFVSVKNKAYIDGFIRFKKSIRRA